MIVAAGCVGASQASANFVDTSASSSSFDYVFVDGRSGATLGDSGVGDAGQFDLVGPFRSTPSNLKIDYEAVVGTGGSFSFLHNIQCVGFCEARVDTLVETTITNLGTDVLMLRYDTQITPGHLGYKGSAQDTRAAFSVRIFEGDDPTTPINLYDMAGEINGLGFNGISGSGVPFNDLIFRQGGDERAYDWGATDLSLFLSPLAPGETRLVSFMTSTFVQAAGYCSSDTICPIEGAQAAFGDPRNTGGGTTRILALDRAFAPFNTFIRVVGANAPPPPNGPVPEPASWALMIVGFAMVGRAMRVRPAARCAV